MTKLTAQEIMNLIEENEWNYDYDVVAIRTQEVPFELGEMDHKSLVWVDGEETDEELDGVSATVCTNIKAVKEHTGESFGGYCGQYTAIIGGSSYTYGEDVGEVVIEDAEVLYIF